MFRNLLLVLLAEHVGKMTLTAVLAIEVLGHEDTGATLFRGTLAPQPLELAAVVDLVVLQDSKLDLGVLVLLLLGLGVGLLLALLTTTEKTEDKMEGRLLLDVVVRKSTAILQLLAGEDQALLVRRNSYGEMIRKEGVEWE